MHTWMRLIPAVLLAVPFTGASLRAGDAETNAKKIEDLQKDVAQLKKDLQDLKDEVRTNSVRGAQVTKDLQDIKNMLRDMSAVSTRQAGYDPRSLRPGGPPPSATITLQNDFSAPATVHINGRSFNLGAYQTLKVPDVPVGPFQYYVEVGGRMVEPPRNETMPPAGYRIQIFTRPPF